ncbi:MAG: ROK family protein [Romboutsia sp.]|uniref:ROK family protein n=1 Tax=Romboutsia sp. TaxID=1965302 RepID=UPI003F358183
MNYLGIDIGGTAVKIAHLNEDGNVLTTDKYSVNFDNYETPILETVLKSVDVFIDKYNVEDFNGICVSATGQIDVNKGEVIGTGGNIKNYDGSKIKEVIEDKYKVKTTVINDANAAVLGELFLGKAKGYKNVVMITIGTGVGGGIIVNGEILQGSLGIGGELGHFSINNKGNMCTCGNRGCYEKYASMTALIKKVEEELGIKEINGKDIFEKISTDENISNIVDNWINDIADGIVSLVHIFNPDIVLVGGAVSEQKELFIDKLEKQIKTKVMKNFLLDLKIEAAKLGNNAGLVGALYYYLKDGEK